MQRPLRVRLFVILLFAFAVSFARAQCLPNVVIVATGGTIAGSGATPATTIGYTSATESIERLIAAVPELKKAALVKGEQIFQIGSENMDNRYWLILAKRVNMLLARHDVDGVVITHGTDTLEETAYFLNLVVKSRKPVVIVGAMRPSTAMSADGPMNLYNAVAVAGSREAAGKGVLVVLNDQINSARDVTKTNTSTPDTFKAAELGLLGYIQGGKPVFYRQSTRAHTTDSEFDIMQLDILPQVDIAYGYVNMNRLAIDAFVAGKAQGIVFGGVGDGSLSGTVKRALAQARQQGAVIVRSSRVGQGIVARNGEVNDDELDFIASDTLNPQKARVLLMLALTKTRNTKEIQRMFHTY